MVGTTSFDPWGKPRNTTGEQPAVGYQSDLTDSDTGLVDMVTRMYSPVLGRFMTQDTVFGSPMDPTSLNQFVYAHDDPVSHLDPNGMRIEGGSGCYMDYCAMYDSGAVGHGRGAVTSSSYWCSTCGSLVKVDGADVPASNEAIVRRENLEAFWRKSTAEAERHMNEQINKLEHARAQEVMFTVVAIGAPAMMGMGRVGGMPGDTPSEMNAKLWGMQEGVYESDLRMYSANQDQMRGTEVTGGGPAPGEVPFSGRDPNFRDKLGLIPRGRSVPGGNLGIWSDHGSEVWFRHWLLTCLT